MMFFIFSLGYLSLCYGQDDPCNSANHKIFPQENFGSRNEKCESMITSRCDYYFVSAWYVVYNASVLNRCPTTGYCGTTYPAWMDGTFPDISEGIVNRTACIKHGQICCDSNVTMMIKNCTSFYVYHFVPLPTCPMAYCFASDLPCEPPTTTSKLVSTTITPTAEPTAYGRSTTMAGNNSHWKTLRKSGVESKPLLIVGISVGVVCLVIVIGVVVWGFKYINKLLPKHNKVGDTPSTGSRANIIENDFNSKSDI